MVKGKRLNLIGRCLLGVGLTLGSVSCGEYYMNPKEELRFFSCNYWEDLNNNGITEYPTEFTGIKNKFKKDEKLELVLRLPIYGIAGKELKFVIYNSKKEIAYATSSKINSNNITFNCGSDFNLIETLLEKGDPGKYLAIASWSNFEKIGSFGHEFEIVE